jgi:membrane protease YdiL (CAAX protease family)
MCAETSRSRVGVAVVGWRRIIWAGGPALLVLAAAVSQLRPVVAVAVIAGWIVLRLPARPASITWAAVLPVAVLLTASWIVGSDSPLGPGPCQDPLSVIAWRRVVDATIVLGLVGGLAVVHGSSLRELGLVAPRRLEAGVAVPAMIVVAAGGLVIGPSVARPFFGNLVFDVPPASLVPALVFGIANSVLEEVGYRGAMQAWLGRVVPMWAAIGFQALVFGLVHAGPEVLALLPVHVALLSLVGVAAGVMRWRTGSLAIPIGIHIGADIALYVGLACRPIS